MLLQKPVPQQNEITQPPKPEVQKKVVKKRPKPKPVPEKVIPQKVVEPEPVPKEIVEDVLEEAAVDDEYEEESEENIEQSSIQPQPITLSEAEVQSATDNYYRMVQQMVESNKHYPRAARRRRVEGEVELSFTILADGSIEGLNSKGNARILTSAAEKAVLAVSPLPKPPMVIAAPVQLSLTMVFKLI